MNENITKQAKDLFDKVYNVSFLLDFNREEKGNVRE